MRGETVRIILSFLFIVLFSVSAFPFSDQTTSERILKEDKGFIEFINYSLTNYQDRDPKMKDTFKTIYQDHFNAQVLHLQSDYKNAFRYVRLSQRTQKDLFHKVIGYYLEDAKDILDKLAPAVIKSKNPRARLYLTLGYRDRSVSSNLKTVGDNSNPKLYSYILHEYVEAIKFARRAKRYGMLAMYESQSLETKRKIYNDLLKKEKLRLDEEDKKNNITGRIKFYERFLDKRDEKQANEAVTPFTKELNKKFEEYVNEPAVKSDKHEDRTARRVRFRREQVLARHLQNLEFSRAEDIIREYVEDFNFKLIVSTYDIIKPETSIDKSMKQVHHFDSYNRLFNRKSEESMLIIVSKDVKVIDDIEEDIKKPRQ